MRGIKRNKFFIESEKTTKSRDSIHKIILRGSSDDDDNTVRYEHIQ
jgi:hypothetical protein